MSRVWWTMFTLMPQGEMHSACSLVAPSFHTTWNVSPELQWRTMVQFSAHVAQTGRRDHVDAGLVLTFVLHQWCGLALAAE